jgi:urea transport system ATP-binding protein
VQQIGEALKHIQRQWSISILLVEQFLDFAWSIADRFYIMRRGRLVQNGDANETSPEAVAALLSL